MTYLPKGQLIGVYGPDTIHPEDIGGNTALTNSGWKDLGNVIGGFVVQASANLGNGIAIVGIANAPGDIWRSMDYGNTWSSVGLSLAAGIAVTGYIGNGISVLGDGGGNIFRSTDFGLTWTNVAIVISPTTIQAFAYLGNGIVLMGDAGGRIFRSTDYGVNWVSQGIIVGATSVASISYLDNGIVIFADFNGHIFRSTDYGAAAGSWTDLGPISGVLSGSLSMENGIVIVFGNPSFRSIDFGATWSSVTLVLSNNYSAYLGNGIAAVGDVSGHIFKTTDFGLTWTDLGIISANNLRGMSYLGNGVTIVGDVAGHIFRNEVGYKTNEAQVNYPRIISGDLGPAGASTRLIDTVIPGTNVYTNVDKTRTLVVSVGCTCISPLWDVDAAAFDIQADATAIPSTLVSPLVGIVTGVVGEQNVFMTTGYVGPGLNYRVNQLITGAGVVTLDRWFEMYI